MGVSVGPALSSQPASFLLPEFTLARLINFSFGIPLFVCYLP